MKQMRVFYTLQNRSVYRSDYTCAVFYGIWEFFGNFMFCLEIALMTKYIWSEYILFRERV